MTNYEINSKNLVNGSITRFQFSFGRTLVKPKSFIIHNFSTFNLQYNVNQYNNSFSIVVGATTYAATIPQGYYQSANSLASAIQTNLNSLGTGLTFSCSVATLTGLMTISAGSAFSIIVTTLENQRLIGFAKNATYSAAITYTAPSVVNLVYSYFLNFKAYQMNVSTIIPIDSVATSMILFQPRQKLNLMKETPSNSNYTNVELTDEWDRPWNFDYYMQIEISDDLTTKK